MAYNQVFYLTLESVIARPECCVLLCLLCNLLMTALDLLLALLPPPRHDHIVLPRLAQLARKIAAGALTLKLQLLFRHFALNVSGVFEEPVHAFFFA